MTDYTAARKKQRQRPYTERRTEECVAKRPKDIVEVDIPEVRSLVSMVPKHFTAGNITSR